MLGTLVSMNGQLTQSEREFLYEAVLNNKPKIVLEVGTWKGGGSTWKIVNALEENGSGVLYTCEIIEEFFNEACKIYENNSFIKLNYENSENLIKRMISDGNIPDFIFFDGPEDEDSAFNDLSLLLPFLKTGTLYSMHDFDPPSVKAKKVRPYLENSIEWELVSKLTEPDSVGICLYRKIL